MEQPTHDLRSHVPTAVENTGRRTLILIGVGILHVGLIWALIVGLASGIVQKGLQEIKAEIVKPTEDKKPPPPPPPDLAHPPPPFVPMPELNIAAETPAPTAIIVQNKVATPPPTVITAAKAVGRTHNCDSFYSDVSQRLNEVGDVLVHYDVGVDGAITNVGVSKSSGSDRLDQSAVACVSTRWRDTPAMNGNTPVASPNHEAIIRFKPFGH
jgi:protein TonB